jgi:hypothetical protein
MLMSEDNGFVSVITTVTSTTELAIYNTYSSCPEDNEDGCRQRYFQQHELTCLLRGDYRGENSLITE